MARVYEVAASRQDDGTWLAEVVGEPEVRAVGRSLEDLEMTAREVLALWFGGAPTDYQVEVRSREVQSL